MNSFKCGCLVTSFSQLDMNNSKEGMAYAVCHALIWFEFGAAPNINKCYIHPNAILQA